MALVPRNHDDTLQRIAQATTIAAFQAIAYEIGREAVIWLREQIRSGAATSEEYIREGLTNWYNNFMSEDYGMDNPGLQRSQRLLEYETPQQLANRWSENSQISPAQSGETRLTGRSRHSSEMSSWQSSQSNSQRQRTMETQQVSRSMNSGGSATESNRNIRSGETPIIYAQPTYRLPETHTTILTTEFFGSGVIRGYDALDVILRLNDYREPLTTKLSLRPANVNGNNLGGIYTPGLYNSKIPQFNFLSPNGADSAVNGAVNMSNSYRAYEAPNATRWPRSAFSFPAFLASGAQPVPKMAAWFEEMYQYYCTLSCEYEIIINNTQQGHAPGNGDLLCCSVIDTYTPGAQGKNNNQTLTQQKLGNVTYWPNVKKHVIYSAYNHCHQPSYYVIKDTHKPGDGRRMVENDGDEQRWTRTNRSLEQDSKMLEEIHLMFFQHPMNTVNNRIVSGVSDTGTSELTSIAKNSFNFQIKMKYIVQFKDLNRNLREPVSGEATGLSLTYPDVAEANNQQII